MAYFNIFSLFKYLLNSIRYRILKNTKIFTILLLVFIIAFLFGTQSKASTPNYTISQQQIDKAFSMLHGTYNRFVCLRFNGNYCIYLVSPDTIKIWANDTSIGSQTNETAWECYYYYPSSNTTSLFWYGNVTGHYGSQDMTGCVANFDIYNQDYVTYYYQTNLLNTDPYISTEQSTIENWSFSNITINGGTISPYYNVEGGSFIRPMYLILNYNNRSYDLEVTRFIEPYTENGNSKFNIVVPKEFFNNILYLISSSTLDMSLDISDSYDNDNYTNYNLGSYNVIIDSSVASDINNTSEKDIQNDMYEEQKKTNDNLQDIKEQQQSTTNSINNLNNSITDSNVDENSVSDIAGLSSGINTTDNTGIDGLFNIVYNAFCTDNIQELNITLPFVNKTFTIGTNISSFFPQDLKTLVGIVVSGYICLYILKDLRTTLDKINEGSPEDVGSDVKKEVL